MRKGFESGNIYISTIDRSEPGVEIIITCTENELMLNINL